MPNIPEIQVMQKERLFEFLTLKKRNSGKVVDGLDWFIDKAKSGMNKEDIAYVEQLIAQNAEM